MRRSSAREDSPAGHRHFDRDRLPLPRRALVAVGRGDDERHRVAPGSQPLDKARMPRTMSASTSTPKTTVTQSIDVWAGGVPASRLARASCETRRNASLTGSGDPPLFAMPQIIAPTPTVTMARQAAAQRRARAMVGCGDWRRPASRGPTDSAWPRTSHSPRHAALSRATSPLAFRSASGPGGPTRGRAAPSWPLPRRHPRGPHLGL